MGRLIAIGSALVDHLARVDDAFLGSVPGRKGGTELVDYDRMAALLARLPAPASRIPGGSAANTAVGCARLGMAAGLLTKIGADEPGAFYLESCRAVGLATAGFKTAPSEPTGRCLSLVTPDGQRTMRTFLGASSSLGPGDIATADFAGYSHAHVEGYLIFNDDLLVRVLETAKAAGCTVSLDVASPEIASGCRSRLLALLARYVDVVLANEDEAVELSGGGDEEGSLTALCRCCPTAVVKLGERGVLIGDRGRRIRIPARKVRAIDTTGAGDLWAAGFLFGRLSGYGPSVSGGLGCLLGGAVVQTLGAQIPDGQWPGIRAWLREQPVTEE